MNPTLIVFDLDGTLAESKSAVTSDMAEALCELLKNKMVAVMSGGAFPQFEKQFLSHLSCVHELLAKLFILPASGTQLWTFDIEKGKWIERYEHDIDEKDRRYIAEVLQKIFDENLPHPPTLYGKVIEDRGSQITFSALGQEAPVEAKRAWDPDQSKRKILQAKLAPLLPDFEVRIGGLTSIDITRKGFDKAYGLRALAEFLHTPIGEILYVGDALFPGGNDEAVKVTDVATRQVSGPDETLSLIGGLL